MKPYGRTKVVKGGSCYPSGKLWKTDYHIHENFRKVKNWWESICNISPKTERQQSKKMLSSHIGYYNNNILS